MITLKRIACALAIGTLIVAGCGDDTVDAPTGGTSTLSGVVESVNTDPIILGAVPAVTVKLIGTNADGDEFELETVTDAGGAFIFEQLTGGDYAICFACVDGNGNEVEDSVEIRIPDGKRVDVTVSFAGGDVSIALTVTESDPELVTIFYCSDGVARTTKITRAQYDANPYAYTVRTPPDCTPRSPKGITFVASGIVDHVAPQLHGGGISIGMPFVIEYSFEPTTPGVLQRPTFASYDKLCYSITVIVGPYTARAGARTGNAGVGDNDFGTTDRYRLYAFDGDLVGADVNGYPLMRAQLLLAMSGGTTALSSTDLPAVPPSLAAFTDGGGMVLSFDDGPVMCNIGASLVSLVMK